MRSDFALSRLPTVRAFSPRSTPSQTLNRASCIPPVPSASVIAPAMTAGAMTRPRTETGMQLLGTKPTLNRCVGRASLATPQSGKPKGNARPALDRFSKRCRGGTTAPGCFRAVIGKRVSAAAASSMSGRPSGPGPDWRTSTASSPTLPSGHVRWLSARASR